MNDPYQIHNGIGIYNIHLYFLYYTYEKIINPLEGDVHSSRKPGS